VGRKGPEKLWGRWDKKKVTREDLLEMAVIDLGLSEEEFFDMTPKEFFIEQWRHIKKDENQWEKVREIIAMIHNASPNAKRKVKGKDIVELSKDQKDQKLEFPEELAREIMKKLN
jgi:hypothetical protein